MFRLGHIITSKVFDINKLSRFFILCDLLGNIHPTEYRNMKFYYDYEKDLIEPIPYDMRKCKFLTTSSEKENQGITGEIEELSPILSLIFNDSIFYNKYISDLKYFSKIDVNLFFNEELKSIDSIQKVMRINPITDYNQKNFINLLKQNQNYIKSKLLPTKIARVSYKESIDENQHLIELENIHDLKITADSVDFNNNSKLNLAFLMNSSTTGKPVNKKYIIINGKLDNIKGVYFSILGDNNVYYEKLLDY